MLEKALILAKIEATYGTDSVPTVAANALLTSPPSIDIIGSRKERAVVLPYHGKLAPINVGEAIKISFSTEMRGSGAATTPPRIGALLRACKFTETISTFVQYDPNSIENHESVTLYFYRDAILHKVMGCVGTVKLSCKANEPAKFDFEFTGLYAGTHVSDSSFPAPTFGDSAAPPLFRSASFSLMGYAAVIEAFNVDTGNSIAKRPSANAATGIYRYFVTGRDVKGDCDPEATALTTFNPWTQYDGSSVGQVTGTIGQASGNRCVVTLPNVCPDVPKYNARETVLTYGYPFTAHPTLTAGNNEVSFKFD